MKKRIGFLVALVLCMGPMLKVEASDSELINIESAFTEENESTVEVLPMTRGTYLLYGSSTITNPAIGYVGTAGSTYATMEVSSISVYVYLQRYTGSSWTTVASWTESATNSRVASGSRTYSVSRGYYYRVYSVHKAATDATFAATSGIYIS